MKILDIIHRQPRPIPWEEGDNIPWNEPGFSERMLKWHLTQDSDAASRRFVVIDRQVAWIHQTVLGSQASRILDLGCGPGLYTSRFAQRGHTCVGVDWSPASIRYARNTASQQGSTCTYIEGDVRQAAFGQGFDLAMFIYGEFNVFKPGDAGLILDKAHLALLPGGKILLEAHTPEAIQRIGQGSNWYASTGGLFSPKPHLVLEEGCWDPESRAATRRHIIIDAESSGVASYAASYQAYSREEYQDLLVSHGFQSVSFIPSLTGEASEADSDFIVIRAERA